MISQNVDDDSMLIRYPSKKQADILNKITASQGFSHLHKSFKGGDNLTWENKIVSARSDNVIEYIYIYIKNGFSSFLRANMPPEAVLHKLKIKKHKKNRIWRSSLKFSQTKTHLATRSVLGKETMGN